MSGVGRVVELDPDTLGVTWATFRAEGNLTIALVREIADPLADSYSKAQYVDVGGRTHFALADLSREHGSRLRFYDMDVFSDPGVRTTGGAVAFMREAPQWIQSPIMLDDRLCVVRNRVKWHGWNVEFMDLDRVTAEGFCLYVDTELKGFHQTSSRQSFLAGDDRQGNLYVRDIRR